MDSNSTQGRAAMDFASDQEIYDIESVAAMRTNSKIFGDKIL